MTAHTTQAAHVVAMNSRTRMSFGRSFLASLAAGTPHHDTGKLSAFLVATKVATAQDLQALAAAGDLTKEVLNDAAIGIVVLTPADQLPKNFSLAS